MNGKRKSTEIRQKEIIDAARKVVVRYGAERVTISRIAKEAGVTPGAIYRHFKSRKAILEGLVDSIEDYLLNDISSLESSTKPSLEAIEQVLFTHMQNIQKRKGASFQVMADIISFGDKKLNKKLYSIMNLYVQKLKDLLSAGIINNKINTDMEVETVAMMVFGMIQGLVNMWAVSNYSFDLEIAFSRMWHIFTKSINN